MLLINIDLIHSPPLGQNLLRQVRQSQLPDLKALGPAFDANVAPWQLRDGANGVFPHGLHRPQVACDISC